MSEDINGQQKPGAGDGTNSEKGEGLTPEELNQEVEFQKDELDYVGEDTSKKIQTAVAQKKHWREKHEKVMTEFEAYKKAHPDAPPVKPQEKKDDKKADDTDHRIAVLELQRDNPDLKLDRESADMAISFAKTQGKTPQEIISSDFFQAYLKGISEKKKAEGGTPSPSHRSGQPTEDWNKYIHDPSLIKGLSKDKFKEFQKWMAENPDKVPKK